MRRLNVVFRIVLFGAALVALKHELAGLVFNDVIAQLASFGWPTVATAIFFTAASFLAMGGFELMGLRYLGTTAARRVPAAFSLITAFVANAFSLSLGVAVLTGTAVRLRAYHRFGLTSGDVFRLSTFVTLTATLGLLVLGAAAFIASPGTADIGQFRIQLLPMGLFLAIPPLFYVVWTLKHAGREYGNGKWMFALPTRGVGALQFALSSFDWLLAATVLFFLLPSELTLSYLAFLPAFFMVQTLATVSHVPGGAGVFEAGLLGLIAHSANEKSAVLASLLVYRLVYYALPLIVALAIAALDQMIGSKSAKLRLPIAVPEAPELV